MLNKKEILISIKPKYVKKIASGEKTMEIRTRKINAKNGDKLFIYTTLPVGEIRYSAIIKNIFYKKPQDVWKNFKEKICLSKEDFYFYVKNKKLITIIELSNVKTLQKAITLNELKDIGIRPPQFIKLVENFYNV